MKKITIKIGILILIILFLPYMITIFLSDTKKIEKVSTEGEPTIAVEENEETKTISLDTYIMGAVAANISVDYELETLKAQAVIIRTYTLKAIDNLKTKGNQNPTTSDIGLSYAQIKDKKETWGDDYDTNYEKIENAVYLTKNEVITYEDELIEPLFHEVSVGKTRSSLEAWGEERPYLISVDSSDDVTSTDYMKITEDSVENVLETITKTYEDISITKEEFFDKIVVSSRDDLGFVTSINIGAVTLTGEEFASMMNLNSSNFYIENYEGKVRFICKGKGHGVGLSQFGANIMAKDKSTYKEILAYYYTNSDIVIYEKE